MKNTNTLSLTKEKEHRIGKTTFIVSSFSDENCTRKATDLIMDMNEFSKQIDICVIEEFIRNGKAYISDHDVLTSEAERYAAKLMDILYKYNYNCDSMKLYVVGGCHYVYPHYQIHIGNTDKKRLFSYFSRLRFCSNKIITATIMTVY